MRELVVQLARVSTPDVGRHWFEPARYFYQLHLPRTVWAWSLSPDRAIAQAKVQIKQD